MLLFTHPDILKFKIMPTPQRFLETSSAEALNIFSKVTWGSCTNNFRNIEPFTWVLLYRLHHADICCFSFSWRGNSVPKWFSPPSSYGNWPNTRYHLSPHALPHFQKHQRFKSFSFFPFFCFYYLLLVSALLPRASVPHRHPAVFPSLWCWYPSAQQWHLKTEALLTPAEDQTPPAHRQWT